MADTSENHQPTRTPPPAKIRVVGDEPSTSELESLCREIGHQWPPRDQAEATAILIKAGTFTPEETRQFLNTIGYPGFESYGELAPGLVCTGEPRFRDRRATWEEFYEEVGVPTFTATLVEGLKRYRQLPDPGDAPFDLVLEETRQSVRRAGDKYADRNPEVVKHDSAWLLLEHLIEEKGGSNLKNVKQILGDEEDTRKNARKYLLPSVEPFDLTIRNWCLMEDFPLASTE